MLAAALTSRNRKDNVKANPGDAAHWYKEPSCSCLIRLCQHFLPTASGQPVPSRSKASAVPWSKNSRSHWVSRASVFGWVGTQESTVCMWEFVCGKWGWHVVQIETVKSKRAPELTLSLSLSITYVSAYLHGYLFIYVFILLHLSIYVCLPIYLSTNLSIYISIFISGFLSWANRTIAKSSSDTLPIFPFGTHKKKVDQLKVLGSIPCFGRISHQLPPGHRGPLNEALLREDLPSFR